MGRGLGSGSKPHPATGCLGRRKNKHVTPLFLKVPILGSAGSPPYITFAHSSQWLILTSDVILDTNGSNYFQTIICVRRSKTKAKNSLYLLQHNLTLAKIHLFHVGLSLAIIPSYPAEGWFHPHCLCESSFCYYNKMAECG